MNFVLDKHQLYVGTMIWKTTLLVIMAEVVEAIHVYSGRCRPFEPWIAGGCEEWDAVDIPQGHQYCRGLLHYTKIPPPEMLSFCLMYYGWHYLANDVAAGAGLAASMAAAEARGKHLNETQLVATVK